MKIIILLGKMPTPLQTTSTIFSLKNMLFYGIITFVFFMILFSAIQASIQQKSITPLVTEVGRQFFLSSQNLQTSSQQILDGGVPYDNNLSLFKNMYNIFLTFSTFFTTFFIIYLWIRILFFIYSHSFFSQQGGWFVSFMLAILSFYVLEVISILIADALASKIINLSDVSRILLIPITSFIVFARACYFILQSVYSHVPNTNIINDTLANTLK